MDYATRGNGREYDITAILDHTAATTTSQYKVAIMDPTSAADMTIKLMEGSATSDEPNYPVGVIQSYQTSNSTNAKLRTYGLSKAYSDGTFSAGDWLVVATATASDATHGYVKKYALYDSSAGAAWVTRGTIGRAMQDATLTGQAVTILVNPQQVTQ